MSSKKREKKRVRDEKKGRAYSNDGVRRLREERKGKKSLV